MQRDPTHPVSAVLTTCAVLADAVSGQPACGDWTQHLGPNADGQTNTLDVLEFLTAWSTGCRAVLSPRSKRC